MFDYVGSENRRSVNLAIVILILAVFNLILNPSFITRKLLKKRYISRSNETQSFEEASKVFYNNTYENYNPIDKIRKKVEVYLSKNFFDMQESKR